MENVIRGFAFVAESHDRIRLNIVGDGSNLEALKKIVKEESIANVHFWGRRPLKEMPRWFEGRRDRGTSLNNQTTFLNPLTEIVQKSLDK